MINLNKVVKLGSISKQLSSRFGGKWRYTGGARWECNDGKFVCRIAIDEDGEMGPKILNYYLYDNEHTPKVVDFLGEVL